MAAAPRPGRSSHALAAARTPWPLPARPGRCSARPSATLGDQLGAVAAAAERAGVLLVELDLGDQRGAIAAAAECAGVLRHRLAAAARGMPMRANDPGEQFDEFVDTNRITASGPLPVRQGGVIIDVDFKDSTRAAVRYLNQRGFCIELIRLRARVPDDWSATSADRLMRLDFEDVVP